MSRKESPIDHRVALVIHEQLGVRLEEVLPSADIVRDLGADSLDTIELVMALEEEFELEISDADGDRIMRHGPMVKNITEYVTKRLGG
jgi:acyl carrier protein